MAKRKLVSASKRGGRTQSARDRLLRAAERLFYRQGIRAVGVEEIANEAGVAKISLYRAFPSKDHLIVAYLEKRNAEYWRRLDGVFSAHVGDPEAQLEAVLTYVADRTTQPGYRGCPFINYCGEFAERSHPGRRVARANKQGFRRRLLLLAEALHATESQKLADGLLLLIEGAYAISQTSGGTDSPGRALVWAAQALVEANGWQGVRKSGRTAIVRPLHRVRGL